jgi:NADH-quinone oxidoreductase subunit N
MTASDVYLLSPEISMVGLAVLVVLADLVFRQKGVVAFLAIVGLAVPVAFSIALWIDIDGEATSQRFLELGQSTTFAVDHFSLFFKFLVVAVVGLVLLVSQDYVGRFAKYRGEYYALILLSAVGMMLLPATTELITIYVSLELATIPLVVLAAFLRDARSTEAAMKFFVLAAISSALLLYGMVLVYGFTGSTQLSVIADRIQEQPVESIAFGAAPLLLGVVLIVAGFGFKMALAPFQMWVPDVYEGSPTPITAYLSVASKAAAFAVLIRVFYLAFGGLSLDWSIGFAVLAVLSMTVGNLMAIAQTNIKRLLAYSTVAHAGYLMVGVAAVAARVGDGPTDIGLGGVLFYLVAYGATNLAAFFAIIAIANKVKGERIDDFAGMGFKAPLLAAALAISLISLIGIPPTAGFIGKIYLFNAAVRADLAWLVVAGAINSVISAYYYLRVIRVMYTGNDTERETVPFSLPARGALAISAVGIVVLGVIPGYVLDVAQSAVGAIVGG